MPSKKQIIIFLFTASLAAFPVFVRAAGLVPCGGVGENPCTVKDAFYMVARVVNWLVLMAGVYATFEIVGGGFWLVASAGNEESVTKHRNQITQAVVGLFIVLAAYMFMNTAVNFILMSKCVVDFKNPLNYVLTMKDPSKCQANPINDSLK